MTSGPAFISNKHRKVFEEIIAQNEYGDNCTFFVRKFKNESEEILHYIDNNLRI